MPLVCYLTFSIEICSACLVMLGISKVGGVHTEIDTLSVMLVHRKIYDINEVWDCEWLYPYVLWECLHYSCNILHTTMKQVMRKAKAGMKEYQLESIFLHHTYMYGGCRHCSYTCICATGDNRYMFDIPNNVTIFVTINVATIRYFWLYKTLLNGHSSEIWMTYLMFFFLFRLVLAFATLLLAFLKCY